MESTGALPARQHADPTPEEGAASRSKAVEHDAQREAGDGNGVFSMGDAGPFRVPIILGFLTLSLGIGYLLSSLRCGVTEGRALGALIAYSHGGLRQETAGSSNHSSAAGALPSDFDLLYTPWGHRHLAAEELPGRLLAPMTAEVQRLIYEHQHPAACAGRGFVVSNGNVDYSGLGSHVHVATQHLGMALELDRIFVWHEAGGAVYTDEVTCGKEYRNFECFFASPSSCTREDAARSGDTVPGDSGAASFRVGLQPDFVPTKVTALFTKYNIRATPAEIKYWWRAQASAYLMRFNDRALARMRALRENTSAVLLAGAPDDAARALPFPPGTVSIHIRHGDKGSEMSLVPSSKYFDAAETLLQLQPFSIKRLGYISTEDPGAIEEARAWKASSGQSWAWMWWDVPRINSNGPDQLARLGLRTGELTLIWWLQLFMALECDAWVGTRGSNWNRLIDELRCVWLPKCPNAYVEVGPPQDWVDYSWRV